LNYEQEFTELVRKHDVMYFYSSDQAVYKRGQESLSKINSLAEKLPRKVVAKIWNARIDETLQPEYRATMYWKEE